MKKKSPFAVAYGTLSLNWTCPLCKSDHEHGIDIADFEGGCSGHGEGEYCYCSTREYRETLECSRCGQNIEVYNS